MLADEAYKEVPMNISFKNIRARTRERAGRSEGGFPRSERVERHGPRLKANYSTKQTINSRCGDENNFHGVEMRSFSFKADS